MSDKATLVKPSAPPTDVNLEGEIASLFVQALNLEIAAEDIDIAGEVIRAGEGIIIDLAPANWDAKEFAEPDRLYLHRSGAGQHVAFGYGRHQCAGQQLARAELQIVFHTLFRRIPTLELAVPIEDIPFKHDRLAFGVYELPVTW